MDKEDILKEAHTRKITHLAFSRPSEKRTKQRNRHNVFDKSDTGKWVREEAVVDSGAVECMTSRKRMPHLTVEETPESRRGDTWTYAGGNEIKKEGKLTINWRTCLGIMQRGVFKVEPVSRTLISVDRLQETGHDVILTKSRPHTVKMKTGEILSLKKDGGMFILDMWF